MKLPSFLIGVILSLFWNIGFAAPYSYVSGVANYDVKFSSIEKQANDQPPFLSDLLTLNPLKFDVVFSPEKSIVTSVSNEKTQLEPFTWNDQISLRLNGTDIQIWKVAAGKSYFYNTKSNWAFQKFSGKKMEIAGLSSFEATLIGPNGKIFSGWLTDQLPAMAGIEILKGSKMALIALDGPVSKISLNHLKRQSVAWKQIFNLKPKIQLYTEKNNPSQKMEKGSKTEQSLFPKFQIVNTKGELITNALVSSQLRLFFFFDVFSPVLTNETSIQQNRKISRDQTYLQKLDRSFSRNQLQIIAPFAYSKTEMEFILPTLKTLQRTNFISDPKNVLFNALGISNFPYAIVVNKEGKILYSTTCFSEDEVNILIMNITKIVK